MRCRVIMPAVDAAQPRDQTMRLLLVDDNQNMRQLIRKLVSSCAEQIDECSDGADALAIYNQHRHDWVLMDISMKRTDGLEAARQIRAADANARIMIVTNYDHPNLRKAAARAGACAYVLKENLMEIPRILFEHTKENLE
jgi:CheY-like chemotaxis protein